MARASLRGMSLVELIVAMGILSIVMLGMSTFLASVWRTQSFTMQTGQDSFAASRGVEGMVDLIRNAQTGADGSFPVAQATATEFSFFADENHDGIIERVHLFYDTSTTPKTIKYGVTNPSTTTPPTYPASDDSVSVVATSVVNDGSEPVFSYYDRTNAALSATPTLADVRMVHVSILVDATPLAGSHAVEISSFASLRNLWRK
ncbi:MAG: prepilin-type N-terminal cleavage/methylation domain-containing protein [Candidatus Moraniibacteriota bacterium]|nr:MAG: prepilin-type N-terminal cleavage/methylation domain-containing protein [Candidatus Moranbacteria bacterium]